MGSFFGNAYECVVVPYAVWLHVADSVSGDGQVRPPLTARLRGMPAAFQRHVARVGPKGVLYYACAATWRAVTTAASAIWKVSREAA